MLGLLGFWSAVGYAADCNELLRLGFTNVLMTTSQHDSLVSSAHSFCSVDYAYASETQQRQVEASFSFLRIKIGGGGGIWTGSISEVQKQFCDLGYTNSAYRDFASTVSQEIHDKALDAWTQCLALQTHGVQVDFNATPNFDAVTINMRDDAPGEIYFVGMDQASRGRAVCTATTLGLPTPIRVKPATRFVLTPENATITCQRVLTNNGDGSTTAPPLRLTVKTSAGAFNMDFPALEWRTVTGLDLQAVRDLLAERKQGFPVQRFNIAHSTPLTTTATTLITVPLTVPGPQPWLVEVALDFDAMATQGLTVAKLAVDGRFVKDPISGTETGARLINNLGTPLRASTGVTYVLTLLPGQHTLTLHSWTDGVGTAMDHTGLVVKASAVLVP
jgi:hypothetical protein